MRTTLALLTFVALFVQAADKSKPQRSTPEPGFKSIFNGKDLTGWEGEDKAWVVRDGAIQSTGGQTKKNWLIWRGGELRDFELRLSFKFTKGNSGVQVRSKEIDKWQVRGYQVEIADATKMGLWHHSLSPEKYRSHLATAGQRVHIGVDGKKKIEQLAEAAKVQSVCRNNEWNELVIKAVGSRLVQKINGVVFAELIDEEAKYAAQSGLLALQDHGKGCVAAFKNIRIKHLRAERRTKRTDRPNNAACASQRPNILYIFTDDQSYRSVSAYEGAHDWVKTPNIDALAKSGMRFKTCYTGASCQMSRSMMLTGRLQHAIKSFDISNYPGCDYDPKVQPFWPANFRKHGYKTACIGKWHLGADVGHGRDWDHSVIWDRMGKKNGSAYYYNTQVRYNGGERVPLGGYSTDRYTELAVDYIQNKSKEDEKPWFLWLCYGGVHGPYTEAERHKEMYVDAPPTDIPSDIFGPRPTKPKHLVNYTKWKKTKDGKPKDFDKRVKKYNRAVGALDEGVGKLIEALKKSGQLDNTLVVYTSDQGFAWGQHGCSAKWMGYDANIAAPLIFSQPGRIKPNQLCAEPVNGVDIVQTFHSIAGIKPVMELHGRDMVPLLEKPSAKLKEPMLLTHTARLYGEKFLEAIKGGIFVGAKPRPAYLMMRDGQYKYIRHMKKDTIEELYNMDKDAEELNNLAVNPEYRSLLKKLREKAVAEVRKKDGAFIDFLPEPKVQ